MTDQQLNDAFKSQESGDINNIKITGFRVFVFRHVICYCSVCEKKQWAKNYFISNISYLIYISLNVIDFCSMIKGREGNGRAQILCTACNFLINQRFVAIAHL